jgi:hypothetical protein
MKQTKMWMLASFSFLLLSGCASDNSIRDSFGIHSDSAEQTRVSLSTEALDKEFLLHANLLNQLVLPQFSALKSRVVTFKKRADELVMLQTAEGNTINNELPQNIILATFPILKEQDGRIYFDFAKGMSSIFAMGDWYASDFSGTEWVSDLQAVPAAKSYIESAEFSGDNQLAIRQVASVDGGEEGMIPVEIKYYLSPYKKNANFEPTLSPDFTNMGFFEVAPQLGLGGSQVLYATKWDQTKTVTFEISSNTPEDYRQAIRDGVLYWNKAFGKTVVQVKDAPSNLTAPDMNHNIIQWVTWDDAGFAYADAQMDPRTGETLHAQVFLTSAFAVIGKQRAKTLLSKLSPAASNVAALLKPSEKSDILKNTKSKKFITLRGLAQKPMCQLDVKTTLTESLRKLTAEKVSDASILKLTQDYLREVVAHEVGHTLGLRHNFAGSLATNFAMADRDRLVSQYIKDGKSPEGVVTSSTVMDYQNFEESALTGDFVAHAPVALKYDQNAIGTLYNKEKWKGNVPLFCTDSHLDMNLPDCIYFDAGASPFEKSAYDFSDHLKTLPVLMEQSFEDAKIESMKNEDDRSASMDQLFSLTGWDVANYVINTRGSAIKALLKQSHFLRTLRQYSDPFSLAVGEDTYSAAEIARLGGLNSILPSVNSNYRSEAFHKFQDLVIQNELFSDDEIEKMLEFGQRFFSEVQNAVADGDMSLTQLMTEKNDLLRGDMRSVLVSKMNDYILGTEGQPILYPSTQLKKKGLWNKNTVVDVKLPRFAVAAMFREHIIQDNAKFLTAGEMADIRTKFTSMIESSFGGMKMNSLDPNSLNTEMRIWWDDQMTVLSAMNGK